MFNSAITSAKVRPRRLVVLLLAVLTSSDLQGVRGFMVNPGTSKNREDWALSDDLMGVLENTVGDWTYEVEALAVLCFFVLEVEGLGLAD